MWLSVGLPLTGKKQAASCRAELIVWGPNTSIACPRCTDTMTMVGEEMVPRGEPGARELGMY